MELVQVKAMAQDMGKIFPTHFVGVPEEKGANNRMKSIMDAKEVLIEAVREFYKEECAKFEGKKFRTKLDERRYGTLKRICMKEGEDYQKLLENFTIVSEHEVMYNGVKYHNPEPVRRLSRNHLFFLSDVNAHIHNMPPRMRNALEAYTNEVEHFIAILRRVN